MPTDRGSLRLALRLLVVSSLPLLDGSEARAEPAVTGVMVVRPHVPQRPGLAISDAQEEMLGRIDNAIVRADADKNPILAQATIVPADLVDKKIAELAIGARLGEDRCAEGLARSLQADSYLRIEVASVEGPLSDAPVAPPDPAVEPPSKDHGKRARKGVGPVERSTPVPPALPPVAPGDVKWTVRYRFTLLPAEGGVVPPEEFFVERETEGVIRNAARSHVIALLERIKGVRASAAQEAPGRGKWIGLGVAGLVVGVVAAGAGGYLLTLDGKSTEELVSPARHTPQRWATTLPGSIAVAGGAVALAGGVAALVRGLRGGRERSSSVNVAPVCALGGGVGGGIAVSGSF